MTPGIGGAKIKQFFSELELQRVSISSFSAFDTDRWMEFGFSQVASELLAHPTQDLVERVERISNYSLEKPVKLVDTSSPLYPKQLEEFMGSPPFYLFLYGNVALLKAKKFAVVASQGASKKHLQLVEAKTEAGVLKGETLVVGVNTEAYKRAAVVPLRWGAPRIIVLDRGLFAALGENLDQEMFPAARLWRYKFDPEVDLVISFCRPDEPFRVGANKVRDQLVVALADRLEAAYVRPRGTMAALTAKAEALGRLVQKGLDPVEN